MQSELQKRDSIIPRKNKCGINRIRAIQFQSWIQKNPLMRRFFNSSYNLTKPFLEDLQYRSQGENHFIIEIIGETGSGKSITSIVLGLCVKGYNVFTPDHVRFERKSLLTKIKTDFRKNDLFILDEQTVGVGIGSDREMLEQQNIEEISRKSGLNIIFNSPTTRSHGTSHYRLMYIKKDVNKRIGFFGILRNMGDMNYLPIGYITLIIPRMTDKKGIPTRFGKFWAEYEQNKDKFIERMLRQKELSRLDYKDMAIEVTKHSHFRKGLTFQAYMFLATELYPTKTVQELKNVAYALYVYFPDLIKKEKVKKAETEKQQRKKGIYCNTCDSKSITYNKTKNERYCRTCGSKDLQMIS